MELAACRGLQVEHLEREVVDLRVISRGKAEAHAQARASRRLVRVRVRVRVRVS